jgi:hypothetical protein
MSELNHLLNFIKRHVQVQLLLSLHFRVGLMNMSISFLLKKLHLVFFVLCLICLFLHFLQLNSSLSSLHSKMMYLFGHKIRR